jgi:hypothetical protein
MSEEPLLVTLGDIGLSASWVVTPAGAKPIAGTQLTVDDQTHTESRTPNWAVVFAVIGFFFFFLGLLFLLVRESTTSGTMQVTVRNGDLVHTAGIPVHSAAGVQEVHERVQYARTLVAQS